MLGAGNYYYMTHWNEMVNSTAVLTVENTTIANQGIYSASYMGDTPLHGAWMRLIVRGWCEADIGTVKQAQNLSHVLIFCKCWRSAKQNKCFGSLFLLNLINFV